MPRLDPETAWRQYLAVQHRLPPLPAPVVPARVPGALAVADGFDLFVLDAWGVLNLGETPIPTARPAIDALRAQGKRVMVLSNDGSTDKAGAVAKHRRRGFDFAPSEIVAGLDLLAETMAHLTPPELLCRIADEPPPYPDLVSRMRLPDHLELAEGIVFLSADDWSEALQARLEASMATRPRPLVVGNPDIASPGESFTAAEPGHYAHRIADRTGIAPIFLGKPFPGVYERVRSLHPDVAPDRVLCVGDTPHTDVLGARAFGFRAMLVEDGFCRGRDVDRLCAESGIWPDFIAPRL